LAACPSGGGGLGKEGRGLFRVGGGDERRSLIRVKNGRRGVILHIVDEKKEKSRTGEEGVGLTIMGL